MSTLENVTDTAVWGSLLGSIALGTFITIQAITDPARRSRFGFFALVTAVSAVVDFMHGRFTTVTYEALRVGVWSFYGASVVWLHGHSTRTFGLAAALPAVLGFATWLWNPDLAMNVALPITLLIAAVAHAGQFYHRRGYSSAVLAAHSVAMAMLCSVYYLVVATGDSRVIVIGYAHWAFLNVLAVIFGWIHLPRELRGLAPVRVERQQAIWFAVAVLLSELAAIAGMLLVFTWPPTLFLIANVAAAAATALLYFNHRHRLVIYTDNVTALLEERTADLRAAQRELARQNEVQAERLKEQEQELQSKAAVIERQRRTELAAQTAGQAAHDIQNILSPMLMGLADLTHAAETGRSAAAATDMIRRRVEDLLELNGQLLALSRRGRLEANPVRLSELVDELRLRFPGQNLTAKHGEPAWISGSWAQMTRAVSNLVSNGLEAAGPHGSVSISTGIAEISQTRRCHLGFITPGRWSRLEVCDDGPGIPDTLMDQIFEPYFSSKKTGERSGSGLGLTIVAAVVDDHKGVVDLESRPGRTSFTIYVPAITPPSEATADEALCGDETVLVTDDDSAMRDWYARILSESGYTVLTAASGHEAIHQLQAGPVDALILDLKMPQMTGYETFFGAMHVHPGIRAIVHSSYIADDDAQRLSALGIDEMLQKPASRRDILLALRRVLASRAS